MPKKPTMSVHDNWGSRPAGGAQRHRTRRPAPGRRSTRYSAWSTEF